MNKSVAGFVKSWTTTVAASKSQRQLEDLLRRYGASGFTVSQDYIDRTALVAFALPREFMGGGTQNEHVQVQMPISIRAVRRRLEGIPSFNAKSDSWKNEQAERVAWRHLLFMCEAALMAVALGVQTLEEAFFAHQIVSDSNGIPLRAVEVVQRFRQLKSGE